MGTPEEHEHPQPITASAADLVRSFVNTYDVEAGKDAFDSPVALSDWMRAGGMAIGDATATEADLERARELREILRDMLIANHDRTDPPTVATERLTAIAREIPIRFSFSDGAVCLRPLGTGVEAGLAMILGAVYESTLEGTWERLKACGSGSCRWVYYDTSKNKSRSWCSMEVCGNREKARRYRERQRSG